MENIFILSVLEIVKYFIEIRTKDFSSSLLVSLLINNDFTRNKASSIRVLC
jgi:hypothetical protein